MDSRFSQFEFKSWFYYFIAVGPWDMRASYDSVFVINKIEIKTVVPHGVIMKANWITAVRPYMQEIGFSNPPPPKSMHTKVLQSVLQKLHVPKRGLPDTWVPSNTVFSICIWLKKSCVYVDPCSSNLCYSKVN